MFSSPLSYPSERISERDARGRQESRPASSDEPGYFADERGRRPTARRLTLQAQPRGRAQQQESSDGHHGEDEEGYRED
jgi:hypothetical protein